MRVGYWCKEFLWRDKLKNTITQLGATPIRINDPLTMIGEEDFDLAVVSLADLFVLMKGELRPLPTGRPILGFFPHVEEHLSEFGSKIGCRSISSRGALDRNLSKMMADLSLT